MAQLDLHNSIKTASALNIQTISSNATTNGNIIDTQGFESVEFVIHSGAVTDGTYTPSVYESDASDMSGAVATASAFLIGTIPVTEPVPTAAAATPLADATFVAADDNKTARIGVLNKHRYVRLTLVSTSVSSGAVISAIAVLGHPHHNVTAKDK